MKRKPPPPPLVFRSPSGLLFRYPGTLCEWEQNRTTESPPQFVCKHCGLDWNSHGAPADVAKHFKIPEGERHKICRIVVQLKPIDTSKVIKGLLAIAKQAMPDTYFASDRRVKLAQRWLKENP